LTLQEKDFPLSFKGEEDKGGKIRHSVIARSPSIEG
jgi:hypothetical protein